MYMAVIAANKPAVPVTVIDRPDFEDARSDDAMVAFVAEAADYARQVRDAGMDETPAGRLSAALDH
jgi:hypothetical protein